MPDSNIEQLWIDPQHLPSLKRMDLSNSKNLKMTPCFQGILNLERLDFTGCINLSHVDPSIGLLTELVFLSLHNCRSLVNLDFGTAATLWSLKVMCLSYCTKLENTPDFSGLSFLQYLDMDRCASLSTIHESIGTLANLRFLSLRDCTNLVGIPVSFNKMTSLITVELCGCSKLTKLDVQRISPSPQQYLIYLNLSFCSISIIPNAIRDLRCLERLNLQGNVFKAVPSSALYFLHNLSYLNLSHCHMLQSLPVLPTENGLSDSVGRYFKTTSGSRNHRSGLYIFDSIELNLSIFTIGYFYWFFIAWVLRLVKSCASDVNKGKPIHFRCGFDIVLPWHGETNDSDGNSVIPIFFNHRFKGGSIVRINDPVMDVDWLGFLFYVTFESNKLNHQSSQTLPCPFYLSFESEHTEERFDMLLNLELNKVDGKHYIWMIFISWEHCHFVETGAQITFKACEDLVVKEWGLRVVTKKDTVCSSSSMRMSVELPLVIVKVKQSRSKSSFEPKIQLPYNWLVSDEDEAERDGAKGERNRSL